LIDTQQHTQRHPSTPTATHTLTLPHPNTHPHTHTHTPSDTPQHTNTHTYPREHIQWLIDVKSISLCRFCLIIKITRSFFKICKTCNNHINLTDNLHLGAHEIEMLSKAVVIILKKSVRNMTDFISILKLLFHFDV